MQCPNTHTTTINNNTATSCMRPEQPQALCAPTKQLSTPLTSSPMLLGNPFSIADAGTPTTNLRPHKAYRHSTCCSAGCARQRPQPSHPRRIGVRRARHIWHRIAQPGACLHTLLPHMRTRCAVCATACPRRRAAVCAPAVLRCSGAASLARCTRQRSCGVAHTGGCTCVQPRRRPRALRMQSWR